MSLRALIVDDDRAMREALELMLTLEDFEILLASDGESALRVARDERPDVVVLDVMMPAVDGREVARRMREDDELRDIPIVFCSALSTEADVWAGWRAGADSYVSKPFDPDQLVAEILRVVGRATVVA